ncbi:hypothetical protein MNV49_000585 [Pseudohyphozyma bogoriensis]|nr:hypothetical protein MNV49_000585 [Pseudohyphozyma bogoriensis]
MADALLPNVPAGTNPFPVYCAALEAIFTRTPSKGFKVRLMVLGAISAVGITVSLVHLVVMFIEGRRRGASPFWIYKIVSREGGAYIVCNARLLTCVFGGINLTLFVGIIHALFTVFFHNAPETNITGWFTFPMISMVVHGWIVAWGLVQAFLLTPDQARLVPARAANIVFLGGGSLLLTALIISASFTTTSFRKATGHYVALMDALGPLEAGWTGTLNVTQILPLEDTLMKMEIDFDDYAKAGSALYLLATLSAFVICAVNGYSLGLARLIRGQIDWRVERLSEGWPMQRVHTIECEAANGDVPAGRPAPSVSAIRRMANCPCPEAGEQKTTQAQDIMALVKAKRDLVLVCTTTTFVDVLLGGYSAWICSNYFRRVALNIPWHTFEFSMTGFLWIYGSGVLVGHCFLVGNAIRNLPSGTPPASAETSQIGNRFDVDLSNLQTEF